MSLYNKYRPTSLDEMIGNETAIGSLNAILKKPDPPHAYLITGETGCGKTTIGRIIAKELDCQDGDFTEMDSASFRGIDTIRDIRRQSHFMATEGKYRVWLLDEVHRQTGDAMSALLKALEDPPPHVAYVLCTTDPQKLLPTIRGRCSQFQVFPLSEREMFQLLRRVVKGENESITRQIYEQITQDSMGLPRNALQILEQVLAVSSDKRLETAKKTAEVQSQTIELCRALMQSTGWKRVADILSGLKGQEPETIRRQVLGYGQAILLKEDNKRAASIMKNFEQPFFNSGFPSVTLACYRVMKG